MQRDRERDALELTTFKRVVSTEAIVDEGGKESKW